MSPEGAPERTQRVLVIDDEAQIQRALKSVLSARHYEVDLAETAERGLELTAEHTPDIIVLDLSLPDMSGLEACRRLREWYRGPILIRGRRLDGPQQLGFNGSKTPQSELQIEPQETVSWEGQQPGSRGVPSQVRVRAAGCYGVQVDGTNFSRAIIFKATLAR